MKPRKNNAESTKKPKAPTLTSRVQALALEVDDLSTDLGEVSRSLAQLRREVMVLRDTSQDSIYDLREVTKQILAELEALRKPRKPSWWKW